MAKKKRNKGQIYKTFLRKPKIEQHVIRKTLVVVNQVHDTDRQKYRYINGKNNETSTKQMRV